MMRTALRCLVVGVCLLLAVAARAQSGVLLALDQEQPDPRVVSLAEMHVSVVIADGDAHVSIMQIFANHTGKPQEGTYVFALPGGSTVSDFAVWDGPVRIPAVVLERKRAEQIYAEAKANAIDPGLLEAGEDAGGSDEAAASAKTSAGFRASITPIPAYGTKRLEIEYHQRLAVDRYASGFTLPLKPAQYHALVAGQMEVHLVLQSTPAIKDFALASKAYALKVTRQDAHEVDAEWSGVNVDFSEDLEARWKLDAGAADQLAVTAFRNPYAPAASPDQRSAASMEPQPGFFLAQMLAGMPAASSAAGKNDEPGRHVVLLMDTSLSMQWDKLERSFQALETALRGLRPVDRFSLLTFNQEVTAFQPQAVQATPDQVDRALAYVRASKLRGGTDLGQAMAAGLAAASEPGSSLYVFTDGNSDRGATVLTSKLAAAYKAQWARSPGHPHTNIFAVGDDANLPLLRLLAANDGLLASVTSTEPVEAKLSAFLAHGSSRPLTGLGLVVSPASAVGPTYLLDEPVFPGSMAAWVGEYAAPMKGLALSVHGDRDGKALNAQATVDLPDQALAHTELPRMWAQARVDALLAQIARDGETRSAVDEIIALARRYKFVTPYTSFLAAPRALLRPRVIRPGDPVLRVHTDPAITSVIAMFPFGLTKPLKHMASEDAGTAKPDGADRVWETRFLAPPEMTDGTYTVRLILRDQNGHTYSEQKTFVIASKAPVVRVKLDRTRYVRGDVLRVRASASALTRTLTAHLEGAAPVSLRWSSAAGASVGELRVPQTLPPGTYRLTVTAEDIAHNVGAEEVRIDVVP